MNTFLYNILPCKFGTFNLFRYINRINNGIKLGIYNFIIFFMLIPNKIFMLKCYNYLCFIFVSSGFLVGFHLNFQMK